jgi:hypothetical protein
MKLTIEAFGKPFVAEWFSDDHRQFSSRDASLVLESFPCLREVDDIELRRSAPKRLIWVWIQDANRRDLWGQGAPQSEAGPPKIIPAYRDDLETSWSGAPWTPQKQAWADILNSELHPKGKPIPLMFDSPSGVRHP